MTQVIKFRLLKSTIIIPYAFFLENREMKGSDYIKTDRSKIRLIRYGVQWAIFSLVLYAGVLFYLFVEDLEKGIIPTFKRPSSVDGFMPIGGFMALRLWLSEGIFDPVHPSGLVILGGAFIISFLFRKSFCGWVCPVGTLSELVSKSGRWIAGRSLKMPVYIDYPLRSVKYLLMTFFLYVILIKMTPQSIWSFLNTPYWKVADIKLLKFFVEPSSTTLIVLFVLFLFSLFYKNFWCRYLCPYGALLGLLAVFGPSRIKRDKERCINCGLCSKNCPSSLPVDKKRLVHSPECTGCLTCVSYCPSDGALDMSIGGKVIPPFLFSLLAIGIFSGLIILGKLTGHWSSSVSPEELMELMPYLNRLVHP